MRRNNSICLLITVFLMMITIFSPLSASAHDLGPWASKYTVARAKTSADHFAFGSPLVRHINGNTMLYYWGTYDRNTFSSALNESLSRWGIIKATEVAGPSAHTQIHSDPDPAYAHYTAYVWQRGSDSIGHIRTGYGNLESEMVFCPYMITSQNHEQRIRVINHELGHIWGLTDIGYEPTYTDSLYGGRGDNHSPGRQDKNAMYIALNKPWYQNPDGRWSWQDAPDSWARNAWRQIDGNWYYFVDYYMLANCYYMINGKNYHFNANGVCTNPYI